MKIEPLVERSIYSMSQGAGFSKSNYSGFSNALVRASNDDQRGFLRSSSFGQPVTTQAECLGLAVPALFNLRRA